MKRYRCSACKKELSKEEVEKYVDGHEGLDFNWGTCKGEEAQIELIDDEKTSTLTSEEEDDFFRRRAKNG